MVDDEAREGRVVNELISGLILKSAEGKTGAIFMQKIDAFWNAVVINRPR